MTDNAPVPANSLATTRTGKIDLAKYRTDDLAERLTELISVPEAFRKILKATFLLAVLSIIGCYFIHSYSAMALMPLLCVCAYSLAMGAIFGLVLGVLRITASALQNIESVLRIVLETTGQVATDYERIQTGELRLPSGGELIEQVYNGVVLPVLEQTVARTFGILSSPLLWTYRRTIGSSVRYLVKRVNRTKVTVEEGQDFALGARAGLAAIAKYSKTIKTYTSTAAEVVGNIGRTIRCYALLPLYTLFFVSMSLATVPILVVRYIAGS